MGHGRVGGGVASGYDPLVAEQHLDLGPGHVGSMGARQKRVEALGRASAGQGQRGGSPLGVGRSERLHATCRGPCRGFRGQSHDAQTV